MHGEPNPLPPITTKAELALYLTEAASLEHQFMAQYLYAAFSLKKDPDERCDDAQFEYVRRWASTIYKVARQEMEHLSIANSILTAIGAEPYYGHPGQFPARSRWYLEEALMAKRPVGLPRPCDIPFHLERFSLTTARRYACMESPHLQWVVERDREALLRWCFEDPQGDCPLILPEQRALGAAPPPLLLESLPLPAGPGVVRDAEGVPQGVQIGTVQDLYDAIDKGLCKLAAELGEPALFSGHCSGQSEIPSEYDIYLFPICDLSTALAGVKLVKTQGEGIDQAPGAESHYQLFVDIAREYAGLLDADPNFESSLPLPLDPGYDEYSDRATALAAEAFHEGYAVMLKMLTGYNSRFSNAAWQESPFLLKMLSETAFAPMMTMLIRSLAEVVTLLPANTGGPAGISFDLSDQDLAWLDDPTNSAYNDLRFYAAPLLEVTARLEAVLLCPIPEAARPRLTFIVQNTTRMIRNLIYNYERGVYPRFDPNNPDINCQPATGCDCE